MGYSTVQHSAVQYSTGVLDPVIPKIMTTFLYLSLALDANSEETDIAIGTNIMATQAISLAKLGDFDLSQRSAEAVLSLDPICLEAIWIKASLLLLDPSVPVLTML